MFWFSGVCIFLQWNSRIKFYDCWWHVWTSFKVKKNSKQNPQKKVGVSLRLVVPQFGIAKLVQRSPISLGFIGVISVISILNGNYKLTYNLVGYHLVEVSFQTPRQCWRVTYVFRADQLNFRLWPKALGGNHGTNSPHPKKSFPLWFNTPRPCPLQVVSNFVRHSSISIGKYR